MGSPQRSCAFGFEYEKIPDTQLPFEGFFKNNIQVSFCISYYFWRNKWFDMSE
jgi:hypothetical protein